MPTPLTLELPLPPNLANARMHWRVKLKEKKAYYALCDQRQLLKQIPPPPRAPLSRAAITAIAYMGATMDMGNLMHRVEKWPCDWLKTRGYIEDDGPKCLRWLGFPEQHIKRDGNYRIVLTLTPEP